MRRATLIVTLAGIVAAVAVAVAFRAYRAAQVATADLLRAAEERSVQTARRAALEQKIRAAERRAAEAERDVNELLKAVRAVGAPRDSAVAADRTPGGRTPRVMTTTTVNPPDSTLTEEEKQRLAQERKYQQELAKKRAEEAKARAAFDEELHFRTAAPADKFHKAIDRVRLLAANAEFQAAIRTLNEALATKPNDLAVPDDIREIQAMLRAQNSPVEVTFTSDGATFVSILGAKPPGQWLTQIVKLMPGDYRVVGRRAGFRDVELLLQIRAGIPPPAVSVMCVQPAGPP